MKRIFIIIAAIFFAYITIAQNSNDAKFLFENGLTNITNVYSDIGYKQIKRSAELGYAMAQNSLGYLYLNGYPEKDYKEAMHWFKKAAAQNLAISQYNIGYMYLNGYDVKKDNIEAFIWFSKSANQNCSEGLLYQGFCYKEGWGCTKDYGKAMNCFQKAAQLYPEKTKEEKDHYEIIRSECNLHIGFLYENGWSPIKQDWDLAHLHYQKAAESGNAQAQCNLGIIYYDGKGTYRKDYSIAYNWFEKSAKKGLAQAQRLLGYMYMNTMGVPQDYDKSYYWTSRAVENGEPQALNNMGYLYMNGWGCTKDYNIAKKYYDMATEKGVAIAMRNIGFMYENGYLNGKENINEALKYYRMAYSNGDKLSKYNIERIEDILNPKKNIPIEKDRSIALVIGNADYKISSLKNPVHDADEIEKKFKDLGIEVIPCKNGTYRELEERIEKFINRAKQYDAAILYYSGHGLQKNGENYIVPIDNEDLTDESKITKNCISINNLLSKLNDTGVKKKILVLDACRIYKVNNNTKKGKFAIGLSQMSLSETINFPDGSFVMYATQYGCRADDGKGQNSPFTSALLKTMNTPNIGISTFFDKVRTETKRLTNGEQNPMYDNNLTEENTNFFFNVKKN